MPVQFEALEYQQFEGEFRRYFKFLNWFGEGDRFAKLYGRLHDPVLTLGLLPEGVPIGQEVNEELEIIESYETGHKQYSALVMADNRTLIPIMEEILQRLEPADVLGTYEPSVMEDRSRYFI